MPSFGLLFVAASCWLAVSGDVSDRGSAPLAVEQGGCTLAGPIPPQPAGGLPEGLSASDWSSIRAAYEAGRHAVSACEDGTLAPNPGQQWMTRFDGRGFTTTPDAGGWAWGLELESFGFPGAERVIEGRAPVSVDGARVAYAWDSTLEEWYENDGRGLEHGYTLHERPRRGGAAEGPLSFTLAVRGGLRAQVQADGHGVHFLNEDGAAVVTYSGLHVFDTDGRDLPARFEQVAGDLRLVVQEEGARYPLTIDPIAQQAYLKASNTETEDYFGWSVSVSGDTVVVGAFQEDSNATGVNGNQSDNSAPDAGAAYVFVRNGTTWSQQAYLKASNTEAEDHFGDSVSISGDTLVVGAAAEDSSAIGVNGDQSDNSAPDAGAAYVFVRNGTTWSQQAYLKASNTEAGDVFGGWGSISGDTVIVTAASEDSNATGVNGDQSDNSAFAAGAAYVFVRSGTTWTQQAYLKASNTEPFDVFGGAVSVSGDTVVIGEQSEDSNATGVNGDQSNNSAPNSGAAFVFARNGTIWSQQAYLKSSNSEADDRFGASVSISGDTMVVGAFFEDSNATGAGGDQSNNSSADSGAAYVFVRNGATWTQQAYLKASNTGVDDRFGWSVSTSGDTAVIGAPFEDSNATGVNGNQNNNSATRSGAAYVLVRNGTTWSQQAYLKASNTGVDDRFGEQLSVAGNTLVVATELEDSNATGVNGNQNNNSATDSGAAYVFDFDLPVAPGTPVCFGDGSGAPCGCGNEATPGSGGGCANAAPMPAGQGAVLSASGTNSTLADDLVLTADFTTNQPGLFFQGNNAIGGGTGITFGDGIRCCGANVVRLEIADPPGTNGPHTTSTTVGILATSPPATTTAGDTRCYQWWYRNPNRSVCGFNFNLSNAVLVTWGP